MIQNVHTIKDTCNKHTWREGRRRGGRKMEHRITRWRTTLFSIALCSMLAGCGHEEGIQQPENTDTSAEQQQEININTQQEDRQQDPWQQDQPEGSPLNGGTAAGGTDSGDGRPIPDQTFELDLAPLGRVTFVSYGPDVDRDPQSDVVFQIQKDGRVTQTLEGMYGDNIRAEESFNRVEAVSFPDYNNDGYDDIITICSYTPASGAEMGTGYSEARIYSGNAQGSFTLQRGVTDAANSAVAEKTVRSILGFMGVGRGNAQTDAQPNAQADAQPDTQSDTRATSGWKQAYIDHLQQLGDNGWDGYSLIYIDDDTIPELVKVGCCEAMGCSIVSYGDDGINETSLNRLYFSYIERGGLLCNSEGNMDYYYDLVYRMEKGRLTQIASGYRGALDTPREFDANGNLVYVYEWEGVRMGEKEYEQALDQVYDGDKARRGYERDMLMTREEAIRAIETHAQ